LYYYAIDFMSSVLGERHWQMNFVWNGREAEGRPHYAQEAE
jgi:hypothetical protein